MNEEAVVELYTVAKQVFYNNWFIKPPKQGTKEYNALAQVAKIVDEVGGTYGDYLDVQFSIFAKIRLFPTALQLVSDRAIKRYKTFLAKKDIFHTSLFTLDKDRLIVHATGLSYKIKEVELPIKQDIRASYAIELSKREDVLEKLLLERAWEYVEYTLVKLAYSKRMPTEGLIRLRDHLKKRIKEELCFKN